MDVTGFTVGWCFIATLIIIVVVIFLLLIYHLFSSLLRGLSFRRSYNDKGELLRGCAASKRRIILSSSQRDIVTQTYRNQMLKELSEIESRKKTQEQLKSVKRKIGYSTQLFLPLLFTLLIARCTVDEYIGIHELTINSHEEKDVDEIHRVYLLKHPRHGIISPGVYIQNNLDFNLYLMPVRYGRDRYDEIPVSEVIPAHSFTSVNHPPSYIFTSPPSYIRSKSSGKTIWVIR